MKVKICGITNLSDARLAIDLGADALGFIFVKSSQRYIAPEAAQKIIHTLEPFIIPVGVFADTPREEIYKTAEQTGIGCVQLHGNELPGQLVNYHLPVYKSFHVDKYFSPATLQQYTGRAYLLDTSADGLLGGTGKTFDWSLAVAAKAYGRIILAGGLNPENIIEAVQTVRPYAVDINSGVESAPGKKDRNKLERLFQALRSL
jgi:phosphoribosylanthranilate isomerase